MRIIVCKLDKFPAGILVMFPMLFIRTFVVCKYEKFQK